MFSKLYLECIDNGLLCADYVPLDSCEMRIHLNLACILSVMLYYRWVDTIKVLFIYARGYIFGMCVFVHVHLASVFQTDTL